MQHNWLEEILLDFRRGFITERDPGDENDNTLTRRLQRIADQVNGKNSQIQAAQSTAPKAGRAGA